MTPTEAPQHLAPAFPPGNGEMAERMRGHSWATTPIGAPASWQSQLRTVIQVILGSSDPMCVVWGPERTFFYNDAYQTALGNKHPAALGEDYLDVWREVRADLDPLVAGAYAGEPTRMDRIDLVIDRTGYLEPTSWSFKFTPVHLDDATVGGLLCTCREIRRWVESEPIPALMLELETRLRAAPTPRATLDVACEALGRALGGVLATFNEFVDGEPVVDVTGEWHARGALSLLGRHDLATWGADRIADVMSGRPEMVRDVTTDPRTAGAAADAYAAIGCRASLNVPFVRDGRVRAMLAVGAAEPRQWSAQDVALATAIGERSWDAVERARAESKAARALADQANTASALHALITSAPIGFAFFDREHRYTSVNSLLAQINGLPIQSHVGRKIDEVLPVTGVAVGRVLEQVFATGKAIDHLEIDGETPASPGERRTWLTGFFPVFDVGRSNVAQVGATVVEITERKRAEALLRQSEERLRLATENAEVGFWDVDELNGRLVWPPIVKAMFGISADVPVTMQDFYDGLHPDDREATSAAYAAAADPSRRALYDVEYRTIGKEDGVVRWVAAKGRGVFDEQGRCVRVIGTALDITERRAIQESLRRSEEQLRIADRKKDEFLATLAHELRNPLAPIGNAAALLQHSGLPQDKVTRYAQMILRQSKSMGVLLDDLLEVSRITTGKLQLKKKTVSVASIVESALEPVRPSLEAKEHSLRVEMDGGEALLEVDPIRMSQVLTNLLHNASKYSERGGSIVLRTIASPQDIAFEVTDNGIGISSEQLPAVFDMFAQVAPTMERSEGGLGIGLAVAKALIEMHGGTIEATSPGLRQGSTFRVIIPRGETVLSPLRVEAPAEERARTAGETVLVADDNIDAAESLAALLEFSGYTVHVARDGVEALELARRVQPKACFVDIGMPHLNGYEVARALRNERDSDIFLVATTGWGQAEDRRRALDAGFDVHMTKPVDIDKIALVMAQRAMPSDGIGTPDGKEA